MKIRRFKDRYDKEWLIECTDNGIPYDMYEHDFRVDVSNNGVPYPSYSYNRADLLSRVGLVEFHCIGGGQHFNNYRVYLTEKGKQLLSDKDK